MKFGFDKDKCTDIGLIVKHGNKDNVVLFFDEIENAAIYRAKLFRTDVEYQEENFVNEVQVLSKEIIYPVKDWVDINGQSSRQVVDKKEISYHIKSLNGRGGVPICNNKLCYQVLRVETDKNNNKHEIWDVKYVEFDKVKYITSLESNRNDLYINIDFLPCGFYFICLEVEDRSGKIIKTAVPYYFKVNELSNKEILNAIHGAGRAASGNCVTFGR